MHLEECRYLIEQQRASFLTRKKLYTSIEEMQTDLDLWISQYNNERTHSGKYCFGKTPMETFISSKHLATEKRIDELLENNNFKMSDETETGSAEEQPARDSLALGNNKVVEQSTTSSKNYFSSNA